MQPRLTHTRFVARLLVACSIALYGAGCGGSSASANVDQTTPPVGNDGGTPEADGGTSPVDGGTSADGGVSAQPDGGSVAPPDGGTGTSPPPTAPQLAGLAAGAVVSGQVSLTASVPAGTAAVQFQADGTTFATVQSAPFEATWDSFPAANGAHALSVVAIDDAGTATASEAVPVTLGNHIKHVFVIVMENHNWSSIKGNPSAPYINGTLLAQGAHAENYGNVPNLHPSLPNYIWLESGGNQGVTDDGNPSSHKLTAQHLTGLLSAAGVSWKSYQEDISGTDCPLVPVNKYFPKHNPPIYFTDVNGGLSSTSSTCIEHVRPFAELSRDLEVRTVPAYSFITPNICDDMHDNSGCATSDSAANGDAWLAKNVPQILNSDAYKQGGALFITWDESEGSNVPIGFIAMSPLAKAGYTGHVAYDHSSTLRTIEEIFGLTPLLGGAASANDLSDLFRNL